VHVGLKLHHLEIKLFGVTLDFFGSVLRAVARVVDKASQKAVRVLGDQLFRVGHVLADGGLAFQIEYLVRVQGVALGRLDEGHVHAPWFVVDPVRAVHHLQQAFAGKRLAVVPPGQIRQVGGVTAQVNNHGVAPVGKGVVEVGLALVKRGRSQLYPLR